MVAAGTGNDGPVTTWTAPSATAPVHATVTVPGSKSQTNRALVLAALAAAQGQGGSTISGALRSRDTDLMIGALRTLGLRVDGAGSDLTVSGRIAPAPDARVDCGLAGTVLRFVPPLAALADAVVEFDGDEQARARPIAPLLDALRGLGVRIDGSGLPFRVRGGGSVAGGTVAIDASASSQFVSGLLLCAASFTDGPDRAAHGFGAAVGAAHRDDGGDAAAGRGGRRRLRAQPLAGERRPGRGPALGGRTRSHQRGPLPRRGRRQRRNGAHHRLAGDQRATRRAHPGGPGQAECRCHPD